MPPPPFTFPSDIRAFSNRLVLDAVVNGPSGAKVKAKEIVELVTPAVNAAVDNFFRALTPYMGQDEDLASQVRIPGLQPWAPLSLDYAKAKSSAAFYVYTGLQPNAPPRRRKMPRETLSYQNVSLIKLFQSLSGTQVFGGAIIDLRDWNDQPVTNAKIAPPPSATQIRFTLLVRPWGTLTKSDLHTPERFLQGKGVLTPRAVDKLTNPRGKQRPLIRPWLAYYSDTILPYVIETALSARFGSVTVKLLKPSDPGPY